MELELFDRQYSNAVAELVHQANSLDPGHPISWAQMTDPHHLQRTGGGMAQTGSDGQSVTIWLDPSRADDMVVGHEVLHVIFDRDGYPKVWDFIPGDTVGKRLAEAVDDVVSHPKIALRLEALGISTDEYKTRFCSGFGAWPEQEPGFPAVLWNAFKIAESLTYMRDHLERNGDPDRVSGCHPVTWGLAKEIAGIVNRIGPNGGRASHRRALVSLVRWADKAVARLAGIQSDFINRLGCRLVLEKGAANEKTSKWLRAETGVKEVEGQPHEFLLFRYIPDGSVVRCFFAARAGECPEFRHDAGIILEDFRRLPLGAFLDRHGLPYHGETFSP